jgi:DNA-binding PadR family transcriptional regulator
MKADMKLFAKGLLELFILRDAEKPVSGRMITEKINELTSGRWKPSPGAIYPLLRRMEGEGLIKPELSNSEGRREITYIITAHGKKHLMEGTRKVMRKSDMSAIFLPLVMKIIYNYNDNEINELKRQFSKCDAFMDHFLELPEKRRKELFIKMCAFFDKLAQS